jgi:hypothetical protein
MIVRLLALLGLLAVCSGAASVAARDEAAARAKMGTNSVARATAAPARPRPLRGVPLRGSTGLRLLVANDPPFLLNVDTRRVTPVSGLDVSDNPVISVLAVGRDAVVWLDRRQRPGNVPTAEIYVVRRNETTAVALATAWEVAPAADGAARLAEEL